jgi:G3E family GTPase
MSIPITVFTGFLGSGKTTLLNKIIKGNPEIKFGLIINEFGEIGIDGKILDNPQEEIIEMSNGCMCCIVRSDLIEAVQKMAETKKVDYILIETSGLAEPLPILQTFTNINPQICFMDGLLTVVDAQNFVHFAQEYQTVLDQIKMADVIVVNKAQDMKPDELENLTLKLKQQNDQCSILINKDDTPASLFIETNSWNVDKLLALEKEEEHNHSHHDHNHEHHDHNEHEHHHHEHEEVDEVVWKTEKLLDPHKMDFWLNNKFPKHAIRSKGILRLQSPNGASNFVFQMVGANKTLSPLSEYTDKTVEISSLVFIGKGLHKDEIIADLDSILG